MSFADAPAPLASRPHRSAMLAIFTIAVMLAVTYAFLQEGVATSFSMFVNVFLAGLLAFNFFEPVAGVLESVLSGSFLSGYEDAFGFVIVFVPVLGGLRMATNAALPAQIDFDQRVDQGGAVVVGLLTGYIVAGMLLCVFQTLPWHENFMSFTSRVDPEEPSHKVRRWFPPDRVWLATVHRASAGPFVQDPVQEFDPKGTFELRCARFRRYGDEREPLESGGEAEPF